MTLPLATVELIRSLQGISNVLTANIAKLDPLGRTRIPVTQAKRWCSTCDRAALRIEELATLIEELAPIIAANEHATARLQRITETIDAVLATVQLEKAES